MPRLKRQIKRLQPLPDHVGIGDFIIKDGDWRVYRVTQVNRALYWADMEQLYWWEALRWWIRQWWKHGAA